MRQKLTELPSNDLNVHNPSYFSNPEIQATRHLTPKFQIPLRIVPENGSAVPVSIHQPDIPAVKINIELPAKDILPQFPLIEKDLALAFQLSYPRCSKRMSLMVKSSRPFQRHSRSRCCQGFQFQFLGSWS